jgi:hypothetical protein
VEATADICDVAPRRVCRDHTCGHVSGVANNDCRTVARNPRFFGTLARFCLP